MCLSLVVLMLTGLATGCAFLSSALAASNSLRSGWWVLQHDPVRPRGYICFVFHVSAGIWQGAPAALLTLAAVVYAQNKFGFIVGMDHIQATLVALFAAIFGSAILGLIATFAALVSGSRIWVHARFRQVLERELTDTLRTPAFNYGVFVLATSLMLPVSAVGMLVLVNPVNPLIVPAFLPTSIIVVVLAFRWTAARIFAAGPRAYLAGVNSPPTEQ